MHGEPDPNLPHLHSLTDYSEDLSANSLSLAISSFLPWELNALLLEDWKARVLFLLDI